MLAQHRLATVAKPVVLITILSLGPLPLLIKLARSLWEREQYQFFPVLLIGAAFCAWERWREERPVGTPKRWAAAGVAFLSLLFVAGGTLLFVRSASGIALILLLAAIALRVGGWRLLWAMLPIGVLLATIVPPPGRQDQTITLRLQHLAVAGSSRLLDALQVPHVQAGNVLEIPGRRLLVEQACSGINSLMSVIAFVLLWGVWKRRACWRVAMLLPMAVVFVMAGNVLRITMDAWLKVRWDIDVLSGTPHELLGLVLFFGCVGMVFSFDALVGKGEGNDAKTQAAGGDLGFIDGMGMGWGDWGVGCVFLAIGIWSQGRVGNAWATSALPAEAYFELPAQLAGWEKVTHEASIIERPQTEAKQSFIWQYRRGDLIACIAIDYPFSGYHELTTCYRMGGWALTGRTSEAGETTVTMSKPAGLNGMLHFSGIDERGEWVMPPPAISAPTFFGAGLRTELEVAGRYGRAEPTYQVQSLLQSYLPVSTETTRSFDELYLAARDALRQQLLAQLPSAPSTKVSK